MSSGGIWNDDSPPTMPEMDVMADKSDSMSADMPIEVVVNDLMRSAPKQKRRRRRRRGTVQKKGAVIADPEEVEMAYDSRSSTSAGMSHESDSVNGTWQCAPRRRRRRKRRNGKRAQ